MTDSTDLCTTLHANAIERPQKPAIYCGDAAISYEELDELSTLLAYWFLDQGLQPGDRVALHWSNSLEVVQLFFALFKADLIAVAVNVRLKPPEIRYILNHSQARMCFSEPALAPLAERADTCCRIHTQVPALRVQTQSASLPRLDPDHPAALLYTSGTTANPKGVIRTHGSLYRSAAIMGADAIEPNDVALAVTQLMHVSALNAVLLPAIYRGASVVLLPACEPSAVLDAIQRFRCTYSLCLPALLHFVCDEQARAPRDVSSVRTMIVGGDTVPVALQHDFRKLFGVELQEIYGMTETVPITLNPKKGIRAGSMGVTMEGVQARIVDRDGYEMAAGETGEIVVRSPANCLGYWDDREASEAAIRDGWLHTGDLACRDADGYFWFRGRQKQIIIRAGSNISPQEVEEALYQHPAVLEAGVVGEPDPVYGEVVVAFVVLRQGYKATPRELQEFARQRIADYKVPERILFLDELPKSPTGKVQRRALKDMLLAAPESQRSATAP